jgi:hypothetical protein
MFWDELVRLDREMHSASAVRVAMAEAYYEFRERDFDCGPRLTVEADPYDSPVPELCVRCGRQFPTRADLRRHREDHAVQDAIARREQETTYGVTLVPAPDDMGVYTCINCLTVKYKDVVDSPVLERCGQCGGDQFRPGHWPPRVYIRRPC